MRNKVRALVRPPGAAYARCRLEGEGLTVHAVDVGEFHAGDAGVTCLSLIR